MLKRKITAIILTLTMLGTYLITLGNVAIAASESLSTQNSRTNNSNIEFNSYFDGGEHSKTFEIGKEAKMYLEIKVKNVGYLKNTVVQFSNANFEIDTEKIENSNIQSSSKTEIKLKQINNSSNSTIIEVPVVMKNGEEIETDFFSKASKVTFTGTYIDKNGKENSVEKEINNELIWQGEAELNLSGNLNKIKLYEMTEEKGVLLQAVVKTGIKDNTLPVAKTRLEVTMPELKMENEAGEEVEVTPTRVTVVANSTKATNGNGSTEFTEANYTYNAETNKIEINVENAEQDGKITWAKNVEDEYIITYVYAGEEIYNYISEQLEKAEETIKTEEQIKAGEVNESAITGELEVIANVEVYGAKEPEISKTEKINYSLEKQSGEIVATSISSTQAISKGYIYANYAKDDKENAEAKKDTPFTVNYTANVYDKQLTDGVTFETVEEKYIDENGEEYSSKVNNKDTIYSKNVSISKEIFNKMLGEEGKIEITNKEGEKLAEITKDTENYEANIEEAKVNEIIIKTTKPITEGKITVSVEKAISAEQGYSKENMKDFERITLGVIGESKKTTELELTEPVTKAEISIDAESLSTIVENKDVELRVLLDTSSIENALYKNPTLQIVLPENIEKIEIKSTNILLDDELKIKESKVYEQDGRKGILVSLEGTQTKYADNGTTNKNEENVIAKGANIVIKADITFKKFAPSANSDILLYYTNENSNLYEKTVAQGKARTANQIGLASTKIEIVSPNGVVTENNMSGYNGTKTISNTETETKIDTINVNDEAKEVTIGGTIVNNYANSIENVFVLGRLPFRGNTKIDGTEELGSNFTMSMKEKISVSGIDESKVKIYYSTNGEATKDLINSENAWTEEPTDLSQVRSYLIVPSGEIATGAQFSFTYKVELPENLNYDNSSYTTYKVYYDNKLEDATLGESKVAGTIGLTTGEAPAISVELSSTADTVREGQIVRMTATIKNKGDMEIENAKLLITAPEGTVHTERTSGTIYFKDSEDQEKVIELGNIKPGDVITKYYDLRIEKGTTLKERQEHVEETDEVITVIEEVNEYPGDKQLQNTVRVSADNITGEIKSESYTLNVLEGDLTIINTSKIAENTTLKKGDKITYRVKLDNISYDKDLTNVTLNVPLPDGIQIDDVYYIRGGSTEQSRDNITTTDNTISVNVGELKSMELYIKNMFAEDESSTVGSSYSEEINICTSAEVYIELSIADYQGEYDLMMTAKADNIETHYSNVQKIIAEKVDLTFTQEELDQRYIKEGTEYTYHFTVRNTGDISSVSNVMEMTLPEGLSLVRAEYELEGKKETVTYSDEYNKLTVRFYELKPGTTLDIAVTVRANLLPDKNDKEVITVATLSANGVDSIQSNSVTAIIEYDASVHQDTDDNIPTQNRYRITGTAWVDENQDGRRDETEELLSGIQVLLIYKSNSNLVTDAIVTTNEEGKYEFNNLLPDEYLVVFLYDAGKYSITDYQKEGVAESCNSDATNMRIILDGEQKYAGVTDTIKITDSNARDMDIGLYVSEKFDLRLDKYISKITVTTPSSGTKVYNYDNSKLTKCEVYSSDVNNSSFVVEYKIVVTNEGQVEGYVKKIIDYLPEDARFSSELNQDWYISDNNGTVYNTALANEKIEPGQSKEVTLVLSFSITDKNIGTLLNNNAEIYESYNERGLQDYDSQEANRLESEDDMSNADIILSLATGTIILYTTLVIAVVILLGIGAYTIKKYVLKKKQN